MHVINSAVVKLGKLTVATKVYRGISGRLLPEQFWAPNEFGVKGGIESAFMSTTLDRDVALQYAAGCAGFVFEIQQGMVDRGSDISWLSQYPHEKEILFAPLTGLEVQSTRVEGSVLVVSVALSVNLNALTIEQVIGKRRKLLADMAANMQGEVRGALTGTGFDELGPKLLMRELRQGVLAEEGVWYNEDEHFELAVQGLMAWKRIVLLEDTRLKLSKPPPPPKSQISTLPTLASSDLTEESSVSYVGAEASRARDATATVGAEASGTRGGSAAAAGATCGDGAAGGDGADGAAGGGGVPTDGVEALPERTQIGGHVASLLSHADEAIRETAAAAIYWLG
eukprot:6771400-Prymnesium_polylepis.1